MKYLFFLLWISNAFSSEMILSNTNDYRPTLSNRLAIQAGANPNFAQLTSLSNFNLSYAKKYSEYWLDFNLQIASGSFQKMTVNNVLATGVATNLLQDDPATHNSLGVGLMIESHFSGELLPFENLYETSSAYITYNSFSSQSVSGTYTGPGVMTKFSLCQKYSDLVSYGANLNYLFASTKRGANNSTETSSATTLTVSYLTIGIDLILTL